MKSIILKDLNSSDAQWCILVADKVEYQVRRCQNDHPFSQTKAYTIFKGLETFFKVSSWIIAIA